MNWKLAQVTIWEPAGYRLTIEADLAQFLGRHNYFNYRTRLLGEFGDILAIDDISVYRGVCVPNSEFISVGILIQLGVPVNSDASTNMEFK